MALNTAISAAEGLKLIEQHGEDIGVLLSDQRMPGEKGVQLLERARQLRPRLVRMMITAKPTPRLSLALEGHLFWLADDRDSLYAVNGTPSDCVHVALTGLLVDRPDLVVSGINHGGNLGADVYYSGTVAAVREAVTRAVTDLGYRADLVARSMRTGASFAVRAMFARTVWRSITTSGVSSTSSVSASTR